MLRPIREWLIEPRVRGLDVDGEEFSLAHRQVLMSKQMLRRLFLHFYRDCRRMDLRYFHGTGSRLEIGSGSSFIGEVYPDVLTSDVKVLPFVDLVLRAEEMPFQNHSLRAIYAINVFHHLPQPRRFFREALRVLHRGGGIVMIEPYYSPLASQLFAHMHASEGFDKTAVRWETDSSTGPFSNANQALSYIVFRRDMMRFRAEFPQFSLLADRPHTHLWYFASGGVNFRQLAPDSWTRLVRGVERIMAPLNPLLALQHTIVLRKR